MKNLLLLIIISMVTVSMTGKRTDAAAIEEAIFGGGCFWCMEPPFEQLEGVIEVVAGYTGGSREDAVYDLVARGKTEHLEAVRVRYDPDVISYEKLVDTFWRQIDPTDDGGQFADRGASYRTAIFFTNKKQQAIAEKSKRELDQSKMFKRPVVTKVLPAKPFYKAEEYHQDYYRKNVLHYERYKEGSGRKSFIENVWGKDGKSKKNYEKPDQATLKRTLTPLQYEVTQKEGTEAPFKNEYWDNKEAGIYVDIVSGEPLFSSLDKFKSGTGWPSFTQPLEKDNIVEKRDISHFMLRTEVRSVHGDSHLGHVFNDGPAPTNLRYCINSASLRFIPVSELEAEGYSEYLHLFR